MVHTSLSSPDRGDAHAPGQAAQLPAPSIAPGLVQQASDRSVDYHVVADHLRGQVLGVYQKVHALVAGLLFSDQCPAEIGVEHGLATEAGQ